MMLDNNEYENLKESLVKSQRLFTKLRKVAHQVKEIDYDESGHYADEEEVYERHWLTLSSKIVDALSGDMKGYSVELLKNSSLDETLLKLNLLKDEQLSKISVSYVDSNSISITQIS